MKRRRKHGYYRNGKLTGYCTHRQFAELKATAERMRQQREAAEAKKQPDADKQH